MAFTTWAALRTAIKDEIADHIAGDPWVGEFRKGERFLRYNSYEELTGLLEKTYRLENLETAGNPANQRSFGGFRRF
ncbi:MAG: hypothetical protein KAT70_06195 [Thermoplasmata archaeon]|nr:hypothetical protein [Thermoplasmata archaeon]